MRLKNLVFSGVLMAVGVLGGALLTADTYATVDCPAGSVRYEEAGGPATANSYAECNLPTPKADDPTLMGTVQKILNVVIGVVGVVAVAVIVISGIFFVTSQGDASKITRARNTLIYGVVGLVVALLAFAIVNFVLTSVFGGNSTTTSGGNSTGGSTGGASNP